MAYKLKVLGKEITVPSVDELKKYLPLTGGTVTGNIITSGSAETSISADYKGGSIQIYGNNSTGTHGLYDVGLSKYMIYGYNSEIMHMVTNENAGGGAKAMQGFCGYASDGTYRRIGIISGSNNVIIGAGGNINNNAATNIYGYTIGMYSTNGSYTAGLFFTYTTNTTYNGYFYPTTTAKTTLGTSANRWFRLYATNSCDTSSDLRLKNNIIPLDSELATFLSGNDTNIFKNIFSGLNPIAYSLNFEDGTENEGKMHFGFGAQDIVKTLEENGLDERSTSFVSHHYWTDEETGEEKDEYGLAYEEFIALNTFMIKEQQKEIEILKSKVDVQQKEINELKELVNQLLNK